MEEPAFRQRTLLKDPESSCSGSWT